MGAKKLQRGVTDTDILIDAQHSIPSALIFLDAQMRAGGICMSFITAMELVQGCRDKNELSALKRFIRNWRIVVLPLTAKSSRLAQALMERYRLSHGLSIPDAVIAATAMGRRFPLYTRNVRHFGYIGNLQVIAPY